MRNKIFPVLCMVIIMIFSCSSRDDVPSDGSAAKKVRIGIITNAVSPFWTAMSKGMGDAAEKFGVEATWKAPSSTDVAEQRKIIEEYEALQVDAIAISPIDAQALTPVINEIINKGISVITIDSDASESNRFCYIGTNNYEAGMALGHELGKLLPNGGKVVSFVGVASAMNARERINGFKETAAQYGITMVDVKEDGVVNEVARQNAEDVLKAHPDISALVGIWSYNAPAIAAAVKEAGLLGKVKVVGFDAEPATIQHLERGEIDVSIAQKPYYFGYLSVMILNDLMRAGEDAVSLMLPKDRIIDTGILVITPETINDFKAYLAKLGIKSS